jgi:hypothetical protein
MVVPSKITLSPLSGRCGCSMTAEKKKGKYTYYRCTGHRGLCGNAYIREEALAELLSTLVQRIQIPATLADEIAASIRTNAGHAEDARQHAQTQAMQRRRTIQAKLDRGYDDYLEGRISQDFWTRKSAEWETELAIVEGEISRLSRLLANLFVERGN